jgi:KaiC/GvpD/RAD55 family RecA-like ATPase
MNYYIQGDAAKADKINAAFEKLGYYTSSYLFNSKSVLYFTLDGEIMATTCYYPTTLRPTTRMDGTGLT